MNTTINNQNFTGEFIKQQRKAKGITQKELAALLNVSDKAVSKWERSESYPEITLFPALADIFNVSIDMLITEQESTPVQNITPIPQDISQFLYRNLDTKISMATVFMAMLFATSFAFIVLTSFIRCAIF